MARNPIKKMVPDSGDADRPLSLVLAGQSIMRETVATPVQTLLNRIDRTRLQMARLLPRRCSTIQYPSESSIL